MNLNEIIADILYDHLKGKHKDDLSIKLANQIIEATKKYQDFKDKDYEDLKPFTQMYDWQKWV
jgi:hypothetical protein